MRCKALKPTSDSRLQDFLGTLQSFEAYLRFQPALIFPLPASRQLRRALTIRYRDFSGDSNIPGTSLDQGVSSHSKSFQQGTRRDGGAGERRLAYILQRAHSFVASKYCKW